MTAALVGRLLTVRIQEGFRLIRASESRYRRIFENIQDVYYEMRADGASRRGAITPFLLPPAALSVESLPTRVVPELAA